MSRYAAGGFIGSSGPDDAVPVIAARGEAYLSRAQFEMLDAVTKLTSGQSLEEALDAKIHIVGEEVAD